MGKRRPKSVVRRAAKKYTRGSRKEWDVENVHGGHRGGAGRPVELEDPQKVLITFEGEHLEFLEQLEDEFQGRLRGRSAVIRNILDKMIQRRQRR